MPATPYYDPNASPDAPRTPRPFAKTEQALTTLHPDDLARLDEHAAERKVSRAEAIRTFVLDGLDREDLRREAGLKP